MGGEQLLGIDPERGHHLQHPPPQIWGELSERVEIGDGCRIGSMVRIADRGRRGASPVRIGADVWIAHGCVIEPGVTIGAGSVVSAGSVVTTSIPGGSLAVGNPARAVRLEMVARPLTQEVAS